MECRKNFPVFRGSRFCYHRYPTPIKKDLFALGIHGMERQIPAYWRKKRNTSPLLIPGFLLCGVTVVTPSTQAQNGNDGFIQGLYLTDSAVSNEIYGVDAGGLQYSEIVYQNGKPFVYYNGGNNSAPVVTLYTFSSCQDIWSLY